MRIAVLSDIHGNEPALEAVLEHAEAQRPDLLAVAGDVVVGAPDSAACWRRVWELVQRGRARLVRGNHERYLLAAAAGDPEFAAPNWAPAAWAAAQLTAAEREAARALPLAVALADDLLLCHAAPADDYHHLHPSTPAAEVAAVFGDGGAPGGGERTVVRGHNHLAFERRVGCTQVVALGAVGLPLDGAPLAAYGLLERTRDGWRVTHQRVRYDVDAAVRRFRDSGYLEAAGPVARLFQREVATGAHQLVPFMRFRRKLTDGVSLDEALERFLRRW